MAVARNLPLRQLGARLREVIDGSIIKKPQVPKVVDNSGADSVEGFREEAVGSLRCWSADAFVLLSLNFSFHLCVIVDSSWKGWAHW